MKITSNEVHMSRKELDELMDLCLSTGIGLTNESFAQTISNPSKDIFDERLKNMSDTLDALDRLSMYNTDLVEELKEMYQISRNKFRNLTA